MSAQTEAPLPTVHVIDDDAAVRESLRLLLELHGHNTLTHASGQAFLDAEPGPSGACAIVDQRMPDMDGLQLQRAMHERGLDLPIVFLTAYGDIPTTVKAFKAGAVDFLTKPVQGDMLLASVRSALASSLAESTTGPTDSAAALESLSERERQVPCWPSKA